MNTRLEPLDVQLVDVANRPERQWNTVSRLVVGCFGVGPQTIEPPVNSPRSSSRIATSGTPARTHR
jgi:hypothetical protein